MHYKQGDVTYSFSYRETRNLYRDFVEMTDDEFFGDQLPHAMHLACFIAFVKEIPTDDMLSDRGLLHEMIHHQVFKLRPAEKAKVRKLFKTLLELV